MMVPLPKKFQKWCLTRFAIKLFISSDKLWTCEVTELFALQPEWLSNKLSIKMTIQVKVNK